MHDRQQCEWCEQPATWHIVWRKGPYERFACAAHIRKTRRLAQLDLGLLAGDAEEGEEIENPHPSPSAPGSDEPDAGKE